MQTLFDIRPAFPSGFRYSENFISEEEEVYLIDRIKYYRPSTFIFHGYEAKRKTLSFGYDYNFAYRELAKGHPIPDDFLPLIKKCASFAGIEYEKIAELLLIEYPVDSVINWHRDAPPFDIIIGVSLSSDCVFKLRPYEKEKQNRKSIVSFPVKRRSVYIIKGEARSQWEHSIAPVRELRYSITLRTLA